MKVNYTRAHILTKTPFRLPLGGGGTDVDWYALKYGGSWGAAAIDLYCMILASRRENEQIRVASSDTVAMVGETAELPNALNLIKAALLQENIMHGLEISTQADVSSRAGLGGSGSMMVGLLHALKVYTGQPVDEIELAEQAFQIEVDLGAPIGPQDQYAAALGGVHWYFRDTDGQMYVEPLEISEISLACLQEGLFLFDTGFRHSTKEILGQHQQQAKTDPLVIENLHQTKKLGLLRREALESGDLDEFGRLLEEHWKIKLKRSSNISNSQICQWHDEGIKAGAVGGYLLGAGGGGHLVFWVNNQSKVKKLREKMKQIGLRERHFRFDMVGTTMPFSCFC